MSIIFILIPLSIVIAAGFLAAFIWAVKSGQYEDTCTPSMRLLTEEVSVCAPRADAQSQRTDGARGDARPPGNPKI
jgi:cbb3-type cytochrome oxidase maturation protein